VEKRKNLNSRLINKMRAKFSIRITNGDGGGGRENRIIE